MKLINIFVKWLKNKYASYFSSYYSFEIVGEIPNSIPAKQILVVSEGGQPDTLAFKCPCGCKSVIQLNLLQDAKPCWKYRVTANGEITISPSIWRKVGCKSHFFLRRGRIEWV